MKNVTVFAVMYSCDSPGCELTTAMREYRNGGLPACHPDWRAFAASLKRLGWHIAANQGGECFCPKHNPKAPEGK